MSFNENDVNRAVNGTFTNRGRTDGEPIGDGTGAADQVQPEYPTVPLDPDETVDAYDDVDELECICGNDTSIDGFAQGGNDGRFGWLAATPAPDGLTSELTTSICYACGRVYRDADFGTGQRIHPVLRYNRDSDEFQTAQALYWTANEI
jgi:hypothetical protein